MLESESHVEQRKRAIIRTFQSKIQLPRCSCSRAYRAAGCARHSPMDIERSRIIRRKAPRYLRESSGMRKRLWNANVQHNARWFLLTTLVWLRAIVARHARSAWMHARPGREAKHRQSARMLSCPRRYRTFRSHTGASLKDERRKISESSRRLVLVKAKCKAHGNNPPRSVPRSVYECTNIARIPSTIVGNLRAGCKPRMLANAHATYDPTSARSLWGLRAVAWEAFILAVKARSHLDGKAESEKAAANQRLDYIFWNEVYFEVKITKSEQ